MKSAIVSIEGKVNCTYTLVYFVFRDENEKKQNKAKKKKKQTNKTKQKKKQKSCVEKLFYHHKSGKSVGSLLTSYVRGLRLVCYALIIKGNCISFVSRCSHLSCSSRRFDSLRNQTILVFCPFSIVLYFHWGTRKQCSD